jgi:hypothetical protein
VGAARGSLISGVPAARDGAVGDDQQIMLTTQTRPTGVERTFGLDEIIVTKTGPRGVITYANAAESRQHATPDAVGAGTQALQRELDGRTYDEFVWAVTNG